MPTPLAIRTGFWIWILGAIAASQTGWLHRQPLLVLPALVLGLTGLLVLAHRGFGSFRAWVDALDLRGLVLLHASRVVGLYLIVISRRGEIPEAFAVPSGLADAAIALGALAVALFPLADATRLRAISIWNIVGLIDVLLVALSAFRLGLANPRDLLALTHLPLSLLPTFLLPLILASHLAILARLNRQPR